ncbi:MAG: hypothetical protein WC712_06595 [Candidatus Brocadiia bacterium]
MLRRLSAIIIVLALALVTAAFSGDLNAEEVIEQPTLPKAPAGADIYLRDSFMRERPEQGEWQRISGNWEYDEAAKPGVSANPFSMRGTSPQEALTVVGEMWWRDYVFASALRAPPAYRFFGIVTNWRSPTEKVFFGFSETDGLVLDLYSGGKQVRLATKATWPYAFQWYNLMLAIQGKRAFALLDEQVIFDVQLPIEVAGKAGIFAARIRDYGVTVDDCSATSLPADPAAAAADALTGFAGIFRAERLQVRRFPDAFIGDRLMRKWASGAADWSAYNPANLTKEELTPDKTMYTYVLPIYNDFSMSFHVKGEVQSGCLSFMSYADPPMQPKPLWEFEYSTQPFAGWMKLKSGGRTLYDNQAVAVGESFELHMSGDDVTVVCKPAQPVSFKVPGQANLLKDGARMVATPPVYELAKINNVLVYSDSIVDETFDNSPSDWMMVYGNWEIGSRWQCTPSYTYLASWDRMTSQLYSKNRFRGRTFYDILVSPKMYSMRQPMYYPFSWFAVSFPKKTGDFSQGLTAVIGYPAVTDMSLMWNGKVVATQKLPEDTNPRSLHHTWIRMRIAIDRTNVAYNIKFIDERAETAEYDLKCTVPMDDAPRNLAIWNSLTGITVPRVRISSQETLRGSLEGAYLNALPAPCGLDTDLRGEIAPDAAINRAPIFDFSEGSAGWSIASNQPGLRTSPVIEAKKRMGLEITAPFCGSRLAFDSPRMAVDARVWKTIKVKYRATAGLAFYIKSSRKIFRAILKGDPQENPTDGAIPILPRLMSNSMDGKFSTVTINVAELFEEYLGGEYDPIIDGLAFERFENPTPDNLGVEAKDIKTYQLGYVDFLSDLPIADTFFPECSIKGVDATSPAVSEFWGGLKMKETRLSPEQMMKAFAAPDRQRYDKRDGVMSVSFRKGFQTLSPVGGPEECLLWRQKDGGDFVLNAYKTSIDGYLGVKLLPEPVRKSEFSAMTVKYRGNLETSAIWIKAGKWIYISCATAANAIKAGRGDKVNALGKKMTMAPLRVFDSDWSWLLVDFNDIPALADKQMIEDVFLSSGIGAAVKESTTFTISSVLFYEPSRLIEYTGRGGKGQTEIQVSNLTGIPFLARSLMLDRSETFMFVPRTVTARTKANSAILTSFDENFAAFRLDSPNIMDEVTVTIGDCTFSGLDLKPGATPNDILILRREIFNWESGDLPWTVIIKHGNDTRTIGTGSLTAATANPPRIYMAQIITEDVLVVNDYERGIGAASSMATGAMLTSGFPSSGISSLETCWPGFSVSLYYQPFDAARYRYCGFDYRYSAPGVILRAAAEGMFKEVLFPGPISGISAEDMKPDGFWHSCDFDLLPALTAQTLNGKYMIRYMVLRDSGSSVAGDYVAIDNFRIYGNRSKTFTVTPRPPTNLKGKLEYEWVLVDADLKTVVGPTRTAESKFTIEIPATKNLYMKVRLVVDGKLSPAEFFRKLPFTWKDK